MLYRQFLHAFFLPFVGYLSCEDARDKGVAAVGAAMRLIDSSGQTIDSGQYLRQMTCGRMRKLLPFPDCPSNPTLMMRRWVTLNYLCNEKGLYYSEDYEMKLRLVADDLGIKRVTQPHFLHRLFPESVT